MPDAPASDSPGWPSDLTLVHAVRRGDRRAIRDLVERLACVPGMLRARERQLSACLSTEERKQVVRDSVTALWGELDRYRGRTPIEAWAWEFVLRAHGQAVEGPIAEVSSTISEEDGRQVARAVEDMLRRDWHGGWKLAAALAAALLFVVLAARFQRGDRPEQRPTGELESERCLAPKGAVRSFAPFLADAELEALWQLEIVVYDEGGVEYLRSPRLEHERWDPAPKQLERLRSVQEIHWTFDVFDATGALRLSGGPSRAWRRR